MRTPTATIPWIQALLALALAAAPAIADDISEEVLWPVPADAMSVAVSSADGDHLASSPCVDEKSHRGVDGKRVTGYETSVAPRSVSVGDGLAHVAQKGEEWVAVVDDDMLVRVTHTFED